MMMKNGFVRTVAVCVCYLTHIRVASSNLCNKCNFIGKRLHCNISTELLSGFSQKFFAVPWHVFNVHIEVEYLLVAPLCASKRMLEWMQFVSSFFIHSRFLASQSHAFGYDDMRQLSSAKSLTMPERLLNTFSWNCVTSVERWTVNMVCVCVCACAQSECEQRTGNGSAIATTTLHK